MSPTCRSRSACWRSCGCSRAGARMSRPRRLELKVSSEQAGTRLDQFLAAPLGSRAHAQSLIDAQRVRVDGRPRPKRHLVRTGELVEVEEEQLAPPQAGASEAPFTVAYEDEH